MLLQEEPLISDHVVRFEVEPNLITYLSRYVHVVIDLEPRSRRKGIHIQNVGLSDRFTLLLDSSHLKFEHVVLEMEEEMRMKMFNETAKMATIIINQDPETRKELLINSTKKSENPFRRGYVFQLPGSHLQFSWVITPPSHLPSFVLIFGREPFLMVLPFLDIVVPDVGNLLGVEEDVHFNPWFDDIERESVFWTRYISSLPIENQVNETPAESQDESQGESQDESLEEPLEESQEEQLEE